MSATDLNKRVTIQRRVTGQDTTGAPLAKWENIVADGDGKIWAGIADIKARRFLAAGAERNSVTTTIRIRYRVGMEASMRVLYEQEIFDIEAVLGTDKRWLDLMCVRGVSNG